MPITISNVAMSTAIVLAVLAAALLVSLRRAEHTALFPPSVSEELKGLAVLKVVFMHISILLVGNAQFLYPLSMPLGIGLDIFLCLSGYGLTVSMLKKPLPILKSYQHRLFKIFIPLWLALLLLFALDAWVLRVDYPLSYILQSFVGWFPTAHAFGDVDSPLWSITWLLMFCFLLPLLFMPNRLWLTALLLVVIANAFAMADPLHLQANWLHRLHGNAFSMGIVLAWLLDDTKGKNRLLENLIWFRNKSGGIGRHLVLILSAGLAAYMLSSGEADDWPRLAPVLSSLHFDPTIFISQTASLITVLMLVIFFVFKKFDCAFLYLFGLYSYGVYLLHWPLIARYDVLFQYLPAWLAVLLWLPILLGLSWCLQKITLVVSALISDKHQQDHSKISRVFE